MFGLQGRFLAKLAFLYANTEPSIVLDAVINGSELAFLFITCNKRLRYVTILSRLSSSRIRLRIGSGSWGVSRKENKGLGSSTLSLSSAFSSWGVLSRTLSCSS